jgi:hypothetical protein
MSKRPFENAEVEAVFRAYPDRMREKLMFLREIVFETAAATVGVGTLRETLKWGQPSYVTAETASGSTVRIDRVKATPTGYAMYFHCQTNLVATFRELYSGRLKFVGDRAILFDEADEVSTPALRHCVSLALTYHRRKTPGPR